MVTSAGVAVPGEVLPELLAGSGVSVGAFTELAGSGVSAGAFTELDELDGDELLDELEFAAGAELLVETVALPLPDAPSEIISAPTVVPEATVAAPGVTDDTGSTGPESPALIGAF